MNWFNYYGLAIITIIMIPNIIFAIKCKNGFENLYKNKVVEISEQVGRFGCFALMIFNIPYTYFNFWFKYALWIYIGVNGGLCIAYNLFWIICRKRNSLLKALSLSIIPSVIFLFSGIVLAYIPLILFALLFGVNHILISYKNSIMVKFEYIKLNTDNFCADSLDNFRRYQKVTECWRKENDAYVIKPVTYTEDWSLTERRKLAERILNDIAKGSAAYGAINGGIIIGFALIDGFRFGSQNQYVALAEFYVSYPFRRLGAGKKLFELSCGAARDMGATKLYISAHSAKESIAAYKSYGCVFAEEINKHLAEKEPFDLQLEFKL